MASCVAGGYLILPIVLPNVLRPASVLIFSLFGVLSILLGFRKTKKKALIIYLLTTLVTFFYLFIGVSAGADEAIPWVFFVYILAPLFWMYFWFWMLDASSPEKIARLLMIFGMLGFALILAFFYIYMILGTGDSLVWLIAEPNVQVEDGKAAATLHVYGSMIFITAAFLAAPGVVKNFILRVGVTGSLVAAAFISGRSAFVLAILVGLLVNLLANKKERSRSHGVFYASLAALFALTLAELISSQIFSGQSLSLVSTLEALVEKISSGGGDARVLQYKALMDGINESWLLGVGHGVAASEIRNYDSNWKYELLWLSTIYHVGLMGFIIYSMPIILSVICYIRLKMAKLNNLHDDFFFGGLISIAVASTTNPYLESFDFQWMVILPCVYFYKRKTRDESIV